MAGYKTMSISRSAYHDEAILDKEISRIFSERLFIGTSHDFNAPGHYHSFRIGRHALTCRATPNGVHAFNNVCLHRNALIDPIGSGKRPFQCGYHGWRYDDDGVLRQAPFLDTDCVHTKNLQKFPTSSNRNLFFTGLNGIAPEIDEVSNIFNELNFSIDLPPFSQGEMMHECNWKLLVENVLENYHLSFVHEKSFTHAGINSTTPANWEHASYTSWGQLKPKTSHLSKALKHLPGSSHHYLHGHIFPNVLLANTNNLIGFISHLLPISAGKTLLKWQMYELPALAALPDTVRTQIKKDALAFSQQVLNEDKALVESCQIGLSSFGHAVQLQPMDDRIENFHKTYKEKMAL